MGWIQYMKDCIESRPDLLKLIHITSVCQGGSHAYTKSRKDTLIHIYGHVLMSLLPVMRQDITVY